MAEPIIKTLLPNPLVEHEQWVISNLFPLQRYTRERVDALIENAQEAFDRARFLTSLPSVQGAQSLADRIESIATFVLSTANEMKRAIEEHHFEKVYLPEESGSVCYALFKGSRPLIQEEERLGEGSYSIVYPVTLEHGPKLVIKELKQNRDLNRVERAYQLGCCHENILPCVGVMDQKTILPRADKTLKEEIGTLSPYTLKKYAISILKGLEYLHGKKLIHGDLKPANILIIDGTVKISDLGFTRSSPSSDHSGSPKYSAPELRAKKEVTTKVDIWAFGATLEEMIYGKESKFAPILSLCFEMDPKKRPSASELLAHKLLN